MIVKTGPQWLNDAVFYEIYPQSFRDSNGDGIGDLRGIEEKLDYLTWLGVNALWVNPCFVSPFQDAGYDVADFCKVAPRYGTNADLRRLTRAAHRRGIRICLDLVAGHTSIEHPWFQASCRPEWNEYSDRYIWTNSGWKRAPEPMQSVVGYADRDGAYVTNFFYCQPALNYGFARPDPACPWQQPVDAPGPRATRRALRNVMAFWLDAGIDGFRVDMAASLVKNDPGSRETSNLWREIRAWLDKRYPEAVLISEWGEPQQAIRAGFHVDFLLHCGSPAYTSLLRAEAGRNVMPGDGHSFFDRSGQGNIRTFLDDYLKMLRTTRGKGHIAIPSGNHDLPHLGVGRTAAELKVIFTFLLTMPGVPFIYQGDEIGMRYLKDLPSKEGGINRTGARTPMQWDRTRNAGFSSAPARKLYLPIDPSKTRPNVAAQAPDPGSLLQHVRRLIALRSMCPSMQSDGTFTPLVAQSGKTAFVYERRQGRQRWIVALNPARSSTNVTFPYRSKRLPKPILATGSRLSMSDGVVTIRLSGVSYGVFGV